MKLLSLTLLLAAALAAVAQEIGDAGYPDETGVAPPTNHHLRRYLADGSTTGPTAVPPTTPPTTPLPTSAPPPPPTTAPPTPAPPTTAPPTPAPPTSAPPTSAPGTPSPGTPAPVTPSPDSGNGATPTPTTQAPSGGKTEDPSVETVAPNTKIPLSTGNDPSSSGNGNKSAKTPAPGSSNSGTVSNKESDSSSLSTGAIAGIVGGAVAGIAILGFVTMTLIRRKREHEDDPLSPFELSMDKGYAGAQGGYGGAAGSAAAGGNGAQRNAPSNHVQELGLTDTPPAGAIAAGVAYSQFYDQATSPGSLHHTHQASAEHEPAAATDNSTNLWMSAMEAQNENDSYLSAKESARDNDSLNSGGRNSYDVGYGADDQSSQISGNSDLNSAKDFPEYDDESARGSYEL